MILQLILARLKEPSTYAGLSVLAVSLGISAETWSVYANALAGIAAVASMLLGEKGYK